MGVALYSGELAIQLVQSHHPFKPQFHDLLDCATVRFWEVGYLIWKLLKPVPQVRDSKSGFPFKAIVRHLHFRR